MIDPAARDWIRLVHERSDARTPLPADVVAELAAHLEEIYENTIARGGTENEALAAAVAVLDQAQFDVVRPRAARPMSRLLDRAAARPSMVRDLGFDIRYAWRKMRHQPVFSLAVVLILALGIGAATAAFAVLDAVLIRPLPYPDSQALIVLNHLTLAGEGRSHAAADWRDYASGSAGRVELAAYASWPMNVTGGGTPERLRSVIVSGNFFDVIGSVPALGRAVNPADDTPSAAPVAVVSHGIWQRRFGGDPSVIGRPIVLNGRPFTVVGVMRAEFALPDRNVDAWIPMALPPAVLDDRASEWLSVFGRLKPGVTVASAQAAFDVTADAMAASFPHTNAGERVVARPLRDEMVKGVRRALWLGAIAVAFVLLAGSANAANLMIARAALRHDEIAIRSALGAEPCRIARQLLVEIVLLASAGEIAGVLIASWFGRAFVLLADGRVPRIETLRLGGAALMASTLAAALCAVVCGGAAVWIVVRHRTRIDTAHGARITSSNPVTAALMAAQVAFALVLIAGSMLVARGYFATRGVDPGFDPSDTLTMQLTLPRSRYPDAASQARFAREAAAELAAVPGVSAAGVVSDLPLLGNALHFRVRPESLAGEGEPMTVRPADEGFFRVLRIRLSAGRLFADETDRRGAPGVALLNHSARDRVGGDAVVGRRIVIAGERPRVVVGIVADIKHGGLRSDEGPVVYVPFAQKTFDFQAWMGIVVRGFGAVPPPTEARAAIARVDMEQPLSALRPMTEYLDEELAPYRFSALVVFGLAFAALVLAITGIYGMAAFMVGRRTRELGVRLALGASRWHVMTLVLKEIAAIVAVGSIAGIAAAAATNTLLQAALADAPSRGANAGALALGCVLLVATAFAGALVPAVRAARIDPKSALQAE